MENAEKDRKIWNLVRTIIFFTLSGLLILYILLEIFLPNVTVKVFQFKPYVVITQSMEPTINKDDLIFVTNPNPDKLEVGDIITFRANIDYSVDGSKEIVTHYIYSITENSSGDLIFRTVRENSTVADAWSLSEDDILGKYAFRIPSLGVFINFVKSPFGIIAIAVNAAVIVAIVVIIKTGKKAEIQKEEDKVEQ
ncbi:MAG: signal peptidase I [Acholeplasmataceae bacterium]|nr:signal peptidase I [Acholeplasmataceae bacterium]